MRICEGVTVYKDDFGNKATIKAMTILPYKGAGRKQSAWELSCYAVYDGNHLYYRSLFDSENAVMYKLQELSCGTFKEINGGN